ncbi:ABC transporter permease [Ammoniphilus oxalaticus]|uniref:ABC transporter permease n=1 Tax=Ammoniphilus oxalaticus TaxID=66863 RepID=A0A419SF44_9BACL|nr:ABC transporter permease subunit [Ammoniphilus oxalaticus]RKD21844.1 ABC transporter permease [Ammoniphilus oxalaticus]
MELRLIGSIFAIAFLFPFFPLLLMSLSGSWRWPELIPVEWSLRTWQYVFSSHSGTYQAVGYSLAIAFAVTAINLLLAIPAGNALARAELRGKTWISAILYSPIIIPPFAAMMGIHFTFVRLQLTETVFGVILAHLPPTLPYVIRALTSSYQTLGYAWEQQAQMLGAGPLQRFWYVALPHLIPGIAVGSALSILVSLSQYLITFLIGSGQVITLPILLFPFLNGGDLGVAAAYTILFTMMALFALVFMDRLLKRYYRQESNQVVKEG